MGILLLIVNVSLIALLMFIVSKKVELDEPMEIIIARRISKLEVVKSKKNCKIKELKFSKNKNNLESHKVKIDALKLEILLIEQEMLKLSSYGKI